MQQFFNQIKHFSAILFLLLFSSCNLDQDKEELIEEDTAIVEQNEDAAGYVTRDIKSFGAKGNGRTNDHEAFVKAAAFFNERGGNGKLIISQGDYLVGKQTFTQGQNGQPAYKGFNLLEFHNVKNMTVSGVGAPKIKYTNGLRYGAFDPATGEPYQHQGGYFVDYRYAAEIGHGISFSGSTNIKIEGIEIDGNNQNFRYGGSYGDVGIQLGHDGIFIWNSRKVVISNMHVHHSGLDGIIIANSFKDNIQDEIEISNSKFEYNNRQGFSWIGGKGLKVTNSSFNHTGRAGIATPPGAGVDIEPELAPVSNGSFEGCEFINNAGVGFVADSGESSDFTFSKCTFWGVTHWSVWVVKPRFTFKECNIYGSLVHAYDAPDNESATKFYACNFEDKPYEGKSPYGAYLVEVNDRRRMLFDNCVFTVNQKKISWLDQPSWWSAEEKYQFNQCRFIIKNAHYPQGDFVGVIRGIRYKDCTTEYLHPDAWQKGYWMNDCCGPLNVDLGGNKTTFASK